MIGSEKQVAWATKIIAQKKKAALEAGISPDQWDRAVSKITSAGTWIDLKDIPAESIARVVAVDDMPELTASSRAQRDLAEKRRIEKIARVDANMKKGIENRDAYITAIIREMGKETGAKAWIDKPTIEMIRAVKATAKASIQPPAEPAAVTKDAVVAKYNDLARRDAALAKVIPDTNLTRSRRDMAQSRATKGDYVAAMRHLADAEAEIVKLEISAGIAPQGTPQPEPVMRVKRAQPDEPAAEAAAGSQKEAVIAKYNALARRDAELDKVVDSSALTAARRDLAMSRRTHGDYEAAMRHLEAAEAKIAEIEAGLVSPAKAAAAQEPPAPKTAADKIKSAAEAAKREIANAKDPHAKFVALSEELRQIAVTAPADERSAARSALMTAYEEMRSAVAAPPEAAPVGVEVYQRSDDGLWVAKRASDGTVGIASTRAEAVANIDKAPSRVPDVEITKPVPGPNAPPEGTRAYLADDGVITEVRPTTSWDEVAEKNKELAARYQAAEQSAASAPEGVEKIKLQRKLREISGQMGEVQYLMRQRAHGGSPDEALDYIRRAVTALDDIVPASAPVSAAPEPNWATLSAKEIAGKYADEMAQIVISAGETITAGLFEDAGAEFAANAAARNAGDLLRRRATQWTANHAQDIAETLAQAAETSASPHSIVEELAKEYVEHAETVARTELARVREEANLDIMRAQGAEKVQFVASEDERLCPVCGAHHGKVYDVHDAPVLPLHPNCRCTLVPYIGDEEVIMSP